MAWGVPEGLGVLLLKHVDEVGVVGVPGGDLPPVQERHVRALVQPRREVGRVQPARPGNTRLIITQVRAFASSSRSRQWAYSIFGYSMYGGPGGLIRYYIRHVHNISGPLT